MDDTVAADVLTLRGWGASFGARIVLASVDWTCPPRA